MTDKVQKIKDWISKEQDGLMDANGNFEYPEHEGAYHILCNLDTYIDSFQEEPVGKDLEEAALLHLSKYYDTSVIWDEDEKCVVRDFKAGANWQKQKDSIVREDLEKASKEWLAPQLDKSYANYGEAKMMELTHFDGYAMLDAIEFGAKWQKEKEYTCYEEAFEDGAKWQKAKDESTTEDLGEYINELSKQFPEVSFAKLSRIAVRVAKWQKKQDQSTIELAEDHAMLAGMEKMKEEMMKEPNLSGYVARDEDGKLHVFEVEPRRLEEKHQWWDRDYNCCIIDNNAFPALRWEDEPISVKLIIIKEE